MPNNWRSRAERLLSNAKINATWGKAPSIEDITERDQERFLADPALVEPIKEEEKEAAAKLLSSYDPEQIAAALLRLHNKQKPAPEELLDFTEMKTKKKHREDLKNGVWVSLSIGRNQKAEPRWIVPMLCGAGNMNKTQIGSIRIHDTETHVEIEEDCARKLVETVGDGGTLEKGITVKRLDHAPAAPKGKGDRGDRGRRSNRSRKSKSYGGSGNEGRSKRNPKKKSGGYESKGGSRKTQRTFKGKKKAR